MKSNSNANFIIIFILIVTTFFVGFFWGYSEASESNLQQIRKFNCYEK